MLLPALSLLVLLMQANSPKTFPCHGTVHTEIGAFSSRHNAGSVGIFGGCARKYCEIVIGYLLLVISSAATQIPSLSAFETNNEQLVTSNFYVPACKKANAELAAIHPSPAAVANWAK